MPDTLLVLGMHRSGTSSVTGVLSLLSGAPPKTLMPADTGNERGCRESIPFFRFHEELLSSAGSTWHDWRAFNPSWYKAPSFNTFKQRAKEFFKAEFAGSSLPVLKDPRICRFTPFWLDVLSEMRLESRAVIPVRSPLKVAQSLKRRDGFPLTKGLMIWLRHALDAEAATRSLPRAIFNWNEFLTDWRKVAGDISAGTGVSWSRLSDRTAREIDDFLSDELKLHSVEDEELAQHPEVHEWVRITYEALLTLAEAPSSNSARAALDEVRRLFDRSCSFFGRVLLDHEIAQEQAQSASEAAQNDRERIAVELGQKNAELQSATAALMDVSSQRDETASNLAERGEELEAAKNSLIEHVRHKHQIAAALEAARTDRDNTASARDAACSARDEIAAALEAARTDREDIAAALEAALAERDDIVSALEAARTEKEQMAAELAQRTQEVGVANEAQAALLGERNAIASVLAEIRDEKDRIALDLARQASEVLAAKNGLAEISTIKELIAAELERTSAEKDAIAARATERQTLLAHQKNVSEEKLRQQEKIATDLQARLIDAEAAFAYKSTISGLRAILGSGRGPRQVARRLLRSALFDPKFYRDHYLSATQTGLDPAEQYIQHGFCQGHFPHPLFDTRYYLTHNEDVRHSGINPLLHYLLHGSRERRNPNAYFDGYWYVSTYPDVVALGVDPLEHYATVGFREARDPSPLFKTAFYLETNPDVSASGMNPLAHFIHHGSHEGRMPAPD